MDKVDHDDFLLVALTENEGCSFFFLDFGDDFLCRDCWWLSDERRVSVSRLVNSDEFDWLPVFLPSVKTALRGIPTAGLL